MYRIVFVLALALCCSCRDAQPQASLTIPLEEARLDDAERFSGSTSWRGSPLRTGLPEAVSLDTLNLADPLHTTTYFSDAVDTLAFVWDRGEEQLHVVRWATRAKPAMIRLPLQPLPDGKLEGIATMTLRAGKAEAHSVETRIGLQVRLFPARSLLIFRVIDARVGTLSTKERHLQIGIIRPNVVSFSDSSRLHLVVDRDGDGVFRLENVVDTTGRFHTAESFPADQPFLVDGLAYEVADIAADGSVLRLQPSALAASLAVGFTAPALDIETLDGTAIDLPALQGKVVVINLWATWCAPCYAEMPRLNTLVARYADEDVVFLAVAPNVKEEVEAALAKVRFDYTMGLISEETADRYFGGANSYPQHIIIDREGTIRYREVGAQEGIETKLDLVIADLL